MKQGKPLRRKTPLRWRGKSSYRQRPRDVSYMLKVKRLPCYVRRHPGWFSAPTTCQGRVQADHLGQRAFGRKSADNTCGPGCEKHHRERTDVSGSFKDWDKYKMRAFCDFVVEWTQREVKEMG